MYDFQIAGTGQSPPAKTEPETADGYGGETRKKGAGWRRVKQKRWFFHRPKRRSPRLVSLPGQRPISSQAPSPHHAEWGRFNDCKEIPVGFLGSPDEFPPVRDSLNCGESPQSRKMRPLSHQKSPRLLGRSLVFLPLVSTIVTNILFMNH